LARPHCWIGAATCEQQALALLSGSVGLLIVTDPLEPGQWPALVSQAQEALSDLSILLWLSRTAPTCCWPQLV